MPKDDRGQHAVAVDGVLAQPNAELLAGDVAGIGISEVELGRRIEGRARSVVDAAEVVAAPIP